ncbi:MAG: hypothetical protein J6W88_05460 [Bacteroidales bacterium]|nr:hypothetical protein [Bacteroidales bacterium]
MNKENVNQNANTECSSEFVKKIKNGEIPFVVSMTPARNKYHKYGSLESMDKLVDSPNPADRIKAAQMGYGLEKLMDDTDDSVLNAVWEYMKPHDEESDCK